MRYLVPLIDNPANHALFIVNDCELDGGFINFDLSLEFEHYLSDEVLGPVGAEMPFLPGQDRVAYMYDRRYGQQYGTGPRPEFFLSAGAGLLATSVLDYGTFLGALDQGDIFA